MIKILHIGYTANFGGIESVIMNLYRNMNRNKIQFDFLAYTQEKVACEDEIISLGGRIYKVTSDCISSDNENLYSRIKRKNSTRKKIDKFFKEHHSEWTVIHRHAESFTQIDELEIAKKYKIPIRIFHSHNTNPYPKSLSGYVRLFGHKFNQNFYKSVPTHYFACSHEAAVWMFGRNIYESGTEKNVVLCNAIDVEKFQYDESLRNKLRRDLNIENKLVVGHVGRFAEQKNHKFIIDIFEELYKKDRDSILMLVGEGSLQSNIENKVKKLNLQEAVLFMGKRSDVHDLLQTMDVFVFPSLYEGLPVTLVEVQASGLPCIISDAITKEVCISDLVTSFPLSTSAKKWVDEIFKKNEKPRGDMCDKVRNAGYDIKCVAKWLENFYLKISKRGEKM